MRGKHLSTSPATDTHHGSFTAAVAVVAPGTSNRISAVPRAAWIVTGAALTLECRGTLRRSLIPEVPASPPRATNDSTVSCRQSGSGTITATARDNVASPRAAAMSTPPTPPLTPLSCGVNADAIPLSQLRACSGLCRQTLDVHVLVNEEQQHVLVNDTLNGHVLGEL